MPSPDYGPLTDLVKYSGILISAAAAIGLTWRRRANWEPSEQDVPKGAAKVSGLLAAVAVGIIWTQYSSSPYKDPLVIAAASLGVTCLVFLLIYGYLIARFVYERTISSRKNQCQIVKVIGGFTLTKDAREQLSNAGSVQKLFEGAAFDADLVWDRGSRALAKQLFVLCFIGLNVCGTLALSCAALLFLLSRT